MGFIVIIGWACVIAGLILSTLLAVKGSSIHAGGFTALGVGGAVFGLIGLLLGLLGSFIVLILFGPLSVAMAGVGLSEIQKRETETETETKETSPMTFEEFKQRKAMMEDPEYAEYMRTVHGVDSTTGMTGEANFNRSVAANPVSVISETEFARLNLKAKHEGLTPSELQMYNDYAQANMAKRGGGVTPSMSTGKLVSIVVGVIFIILLLWFAFDYTQNAPVNKTLGTILMYGNLLISN